jgi:hypothetical protein
MHQDDYLETGVSLTLLEASNLYNRVSLKAILRRMRAGLGGRSQQLPCLGKLESISRGGHHHRGAQAVQIDLIRGSENRCGDFDADFYPLQDHTRDRWIRVATARLQGTPLPPVELVRAGEDYFVRDGHHRISVERALGGSYIDAVVTV